MNQDLHESAIQLLRNQVASCRNLIKLVEIESASGEKEQAQRTVAHIERSYNTVLSFLSDPKYATYITDEERLELQAEMKRIQSDINILEID